MPRVLLFGPFGQRYHHPICLGSAKLWTFLPPGTDFAGWFTVLKALQAGFQSLDQIYWIPWRNFSSIVQPRGKFLGCWLQVNGEAWKNTKWWPFDVSHWSHWAPVGSRKGGERAFGEVPQFLRIEESPEKPNREANYQQAWKFWVENRVGERFLLEREVVLVALLGKGKELELKQAMIIYSSIKQDRKKVEEL